MRINTIFEDSEVGRGSILVMLMGLIMAIIKQIQNAKGYTDDQAAMEFSANSNQYNAELMKLATAACEKQTEFSSSKCDDLINNAIWEQCEHFGDKFLKDGCDGISYRKITSFDTSAWWFGGVMGLLAGGILAGFIWTAVYCLCLKNKGPKGGLGPQKNPQNGPLNVPEQKNQLPAPGSTAPIQNNPAPNGPAPQQPAGKPAPGVTANQEQYLW